MAKLPAEMTDDELAATFQRISGERLGARMPRRSVLNRIIESLLDEKNKRHAAT